MAIEIPFIDFNITSIDINLVISVALAFAIGMISVIIYGRISDAAKRRADRGQSEAVIEAIVAEYSRRLRDYDRLMGDLRARIDILEMRSSAQQPIITQYQAPVQETSRQIYTSQQVAPHTPTVSDSVTVTQHAPSQVVRAQAPEVIPDSHNGTNDYILKLLVEKPRSSREIQRSIGRTREHTARLMKKMYQEGLVSRDGNGKPFTYEITDAGRARLKSQGQSRPQRHDISDDAEARAAEELQAQPSA